MASRPTFQRTSTEGHGNGQDVELQDSPSSHSSSQKGGDFEKGDPDKKDGTTFGIHSAPALEDELPDYGEAGDGFAKVSEPVTSARDLVTQVIHVDDDPTLSPYTFRTFFLGELVFPKSISVVLTKARYRSVHLRIRPAGDLLLQATDHLRVRGVPLRDCLCPGRVHVLRHSAHWPAPLSQSRSIQPEGACCHHHHGVRRCASCNIH